VAYDPFDSNRVLIGGDTNWSGPVVLVSTDLGQTWTSSSHGLTSRVNVIVPHPAIPGCYYCGTQDGLYRSTDSARTWTSVWSGGAVRAIVVDHEATGDIVYIGSSTGVSYTADDGASWMPLNDGLSNTSILALATSGDSGPGDLYAGTEGGGIFRSSSASGIAGHGSRLPGPGQPISVAVSPNLCRTTARLTVRLAEPATLQGGIFDRTGRAVLDLGIRHLPAGTWALTSDLRRLPAGSDFIRLRAGGQMCSTRFVKVE